MISLPLLSPLPDVEFSFQNATPFGTSVLWAMNNRDCDMLADRVNPAVICMAYAATAIKLLADAKARSV